MPHPCADPNPKVPRCTHSGQGKSVNTHRHENCHEKKKKTQRKAKSTQTEGCRLVQSPAGLLLSQLLHVHGISSVVLERRDIAQFLRDLRSREPD